VETAPSASRAAVCRAALGESASAAFWQKQEKHPLIEQISAIDLSRIDLSSNEMDGKEKIIVSLKILSHVDKGRALLDRLLPLIVSEKVIYSMINHTTRNGAAIPVDHDRARVEIENSLAIGAFLLTLSHESSHAIDLVQRPEFRRLFRTTEGLMLVLETEHRAYGTQAGILEELRERFPGFKEAEIALNQKFDQRNGTSTIPTTREKFTNLITNGSYSVPRNLVNDYFNANSWEKYP
jgi:hypothetical protein